jgi:predicted regulator of Ras-like GTPase activity (Roadblock/LC7/MglB family)
MSFLPHLEAVVTQVDGAIACSVMGFDGIAVETHQSPALANHAADVDLQTAWIEYGNLLSQLKNQAESMKTGGVTELSVNTEKLITVMRLVTPEYFVVLGLKPTGNYGKGRYMLRLAAPKLKADL